MTIWIIVGCLVLLFPVVALLLLFVEKTLRRIWRQFLVVAGIFLLVLVVAGIFLIIFADKRSSES